jgi:hypothetical protein
MEQQPSRYQKVKDWATSWLRKTPVQAEPATVAPSAPSTSIPMSTTVVSDQILKQQKEETLHAFAVLEARINELFEVYGIIDRRGRRIEEEDSFVGGVHISLPRFRDEFLARSLTPDSIETAQSYISCINAELSRAYPKEKIQQDRERILKYKQEMEERRSWHARFEEWERTHTEDYTKTHQAEYRSWMHQRPS